MNEPSILETVKKELATRLALAGLAVMLQKECNGEHKEQGDFLLDVARNYPSDRVMFTAERMAIVTDQFMKKVAQEEGSGGEPETPRTPNERWADDSIQFPRLIAEINAMGLEERQWDTLSMEMGLDSEHLSELFDRATTKWDEIKAKL